MYIVFCYKYINIGAAEVKKEYARYSLFFFFFSFRDFRPNPCLWRLGAYVSQELAQVKLRLNSLSVCYSSLKNQHHSTNMTILKLTSLPSLHARRKPVRFCVAELPDDPLGTGHCPSKLRSGSRGIFIPGPQAIGAQVTICCPGANSLSSRSRIIWLKLY